MHTAGCRLCREMCRCEQGCQWMCSVHMLVHVCACASSRAAVPHCRGVCAVCVQHTVRLQSLPALCVCESSVCTCVQCVCVCVHTAAVQTLQLCAWDACACVCVLGLQSRSVCTCLHVEARGCSRCQQSCVYIRVDICVCMRAHVPWGLIPCSSVHTQCVCVQCVPAVQTPWAADPAGVSACACSCLHACLGGCGPLGAVHTDARAIHSRRHTQRTLVQRTAV